ncbi:hypothetical protein [Flaviflagellibacter deserti]|uniref:Uncharacterized protein n=1 Tax=Flaviflagellibacter deserti TaxID=2267266 RepID=A0ABV9Z342_9HYPH
MQELSNSALHRMLDAIASGRPNDVSPADVRASLEEVGIRSLDDLSERLLERVRRSGGDLRQPAPIDLRSLRRPPLDGLEASLEHAVPQIPFRWSGKLHEPSEIRRFDGKAIAYVPSAGPDGSVQLDIVDDIQAVRSWIEARTVSGLIHSFRNGSDDSTRSIPAHYPRSIQVGEHELTGVIGPEDPAGLWVGETLTLEPGRAYFDLTDVYLSWPWSTWNDKISFIGISRSYCQFWDHINFQGDCLLAGAHVGGNWLPFLSQVGWNDRISSFANAG